MKAQVIPQGWTTNASGLACNPDPLLGGIIDKNIVSGEWFAIFNCEEIEPIEGIQSRGEAFDAFQTVIAGKFITD